MTRPLASSATIAQDRPMLLVATNARACNRNSGNACLRIGNRNNSNNNANLPQAGD